MGDLCDVIGNSWGGTHRSTKGNRELCDIVKHRDAHLLGAVINDSASLAHPSVTNNEIDGHIHAQADNHVEFGTITAMLASPNLKRDRKLCLIIATSVVNNALYGDG